MEPNVHLCLILHLQQADGFEHVHMTVEKDLPETFSDNDCLLLSARHPDVSRKLGFRPKGLGPGCG